MHRKVWTPLRLAVLLTSMVLMFSDPSPWRTTYMQSSHRNYLPGPQYCPQTGRTICERVDFYPSEQIYYVLSIAEANNFNLSSLFMNEQRGDLEPNEAKLPTRPIYNYGPSFSRMRYASMNRQSYQIANQRIAAWSQIRAGEWHQITASYGPVGTLAPSSEVRGQRSSQYGQRQPQYGARRKLQPIHMEQLMEAADNSKEISRTRRSFGDDSDLLCSARTIYIMPKAALSDNSQWKYIANVPERNQQFQQILRVDLCARPGEECSPVVQVPLGYVSHCRQKYIKKKLVSLNADGLGTSQENFFVPSCCVCEITRTIGK